ncbi:MAG: HAD family hydrolase [Ruminococcaceae bacterium]|nr:HAD family hydrolase [Oscillospiraceae bacterium]
MKQARYDLVIFDLDGTLLDTSDGVLTAVRYTIDKMGLAPLSEEVLATFIGPPIQNSIAKAYGLEGEVVQEISGIFRDYYSKPEALLRATPYEGIFRLLEALAESGIKTAVATYKREDYAIDLLRHFGFHRYMSIMHGGDHENKLKKRDIIELCIKESGVTDVSRVVMVGDTDNDAIGAAAIGADFIGVTYGFGFRTASDVDAFGNVGTASTVAEVADIVLRTAK